MKIAAGEFKARCLKLIVRVHDFHEEVVITKFGKPFAKLVPLETRPSKPLYGFLKGAVDIGPDIVSPTGEKWEADA